MNCSEEEGLICSDPTDNSPCPVCCHHEPTDDTTCVGENVHYRAFLEDVVSNSCANYCDDDSECFAWEIQNSCGTYALSLQGWIDEEPIMFAEEFAADHCAVCGERQQVVFMKRPGSTEIEGPYVSGFPTDEEYESILLPHYRPVCVQSQCMLHGVGAWRWCMAPLSLTSPPCTGDSTFRRPKREEPLRWPPVRRAE
jgi:hypothetical protein